MLKQNSSGVGAGVTEGAKDTVGAGVGTDVGAAVSQEHRICASTPICATVPAGMQVPDPERSPSYAGRDVTFRAASFWTHPSVQLPVHVKRTRESSPTLQVYLMKKEFGST
jgi:hypothetical protein